MGASLLTCCELVEVAWLYTLKKCCFPVITFKKCPKNKGSCSRGVEDFQAVQIPRSPARTHPPKSPRSQGLPAILALNDEKHKQFLYLGSGSAAAAGTGRKKPQTIARRSSILENANVTVSSNLYVVSLSRNDSTSSTDKVSQLYNPVKSITIEKVPERTSLSKRRTNLGAEELIL